MLLSLEEVIDRICPGECPACSAELPQPGVECSQCGELPAKLRQEAAEELAVPGALAAKQAELLRAEAERLRDEQIAVLAEADRVLFLDQLRQHLDRAEADLTAALARRDQAEARVPGLEKAEQRAARDLAETTQVRGDYARLQQRAERYRQGTRAVVEARRRLELGDEEVAVKQAALAAATEARKQAEATLAAADEETGRLARLRDRAAWRLEHPEQTGLSMASMNMLAIPVLAIAQAVAPLRLGKPGNQFTLADVSQDDRVAFAVAVAGQLGALTGMSAAEHNAGAEAGRKQLAAEQAGQPRVLADLVLPPRVLPR
jgi:hypothetical protein